MNPYAALCDDFGIFAYLNTKLELPTGTETVLHFFEAIQKSFPNMTEFERRETGEYALEEDREEGSMRSVTLEPRRLASAHMNPDSLEDADRQHERVLEIAPYHLDLSSLNCESLDVVFTFAKASDGPWPPPASRIARRKRSASGCWNSSSENSSAWVSSNHG